MPTPKKTRSQTARSAIVLLPPFLLALTSVIFEYAGKGMVSYSPQVILRPLLLVWGILLILIWPTKQLTKNEDWTSLSLLIFAMVFFLSNVLFIVFSSIFLVAVSLWAIIYFLLKKKLQIKFVNFISMSIILVLLTASLARIGSKFMQVNWASYRASLPSQRNVTTEYANNNINYKPDIYYIILDGYGREDTLRTYYGYDNAPFIKYLTDKGFTVPSQINTNYAKTSVSIPSTLNANYVENFAPSLQDSIFWWAMQPFVEESYVQQFLKELGYQSVAIKSDWEITNNRNADIYFSNYQIQLTDFESSFLAKTKLTLLQKGQTHPPQKGKSLI